MEIIFATGNKNKMKEINEILEGTGLTAVSMKDAGVDIDIVEDGKTFSENALIKAGAVAKASGKPAMADDSGLEVDFMDKAPGVYSARFLGEDTSYNIKNKYIIDKLEGVEEEKRSARFVCAIALVTPEGDSFVTEGTIEGRVAHEPAGENGFGYDPIFFLPEYGKTSAEISPQEKNSISHRGKALTAMVELLKDKKMI